MGPKKAGGMGRKGSCRRRAQGGAAARRVRGRRTAMVSCADLGGHGPVDARDKHAAGCHGRLCGSPPHVCASWRRLDAPIRPPRPGLMVLSQRLANIAASGGLGTHGHVQPATWVKRPAAQFAGGASHSVAGRSQAAARATRPLPKVWRVRAAQVFRPLPPSPWCDVRSGSHHSSAKVGMGVPLLIFTIMLLLAFLLN